MANQPSGPSLQRVGIVGAVGAGSMGAMMSLGLAENGYQVYLWDVNSKNVRSALQKAQQAQPTKDRIEGFADLSSFANSFGERPKILLFSISHGHPADDVIRMLDDAGAWRKGDIVLDGGNEYYRTTERRQRAMADKGIAWIGIGVSGGYQSARRGPSLSPGGDRAAVDVVMPLLQNFAAKWNIVDGKERPCVEYMCPAGAGHYVKMAHNGIENGILGTICESWALLHDCLGMVDNDISKVLGDWNREGELRGTYLLEIGAEINERRKSGGAGSLESGHILDDVLDKVVQDDDNSEGTGFWTVMELAARHVPCPTIATAQYLRYASGNRARRLKVHEQLKIPGVKAAQLEGEERTRFIADLHLALYAATLASFCQGLELLARASQDEGWNVDLAACIRICRRDCIIQSDHIADLLDQILTSNSFAPNHPTIVDIKLIAEVANELHRTYEPLKRVVLKATEWNANIPSLSASLEYLKYEGSTALPTQFMEAEMDFFGAHGFDRPGVRGEDPGKPRKGVHHYEWRPA